MLSLLLKQVLDVVFLDFFLKLYQVFFEYLLYLDLEQFEIHDDRDLAAFSEAIKSKGYEVVYKDWDPVMN